MIVVFGSINADIVMNVLHLPRPDRPTILCPDYHLVAGGKGAAQAIAAAQAGASVKLFSCIGDDSFGQFSLAALKNSPVDLTHVRVCPGKPTGCAQVCVDAKGETLRIIASGVNQELRGADVPDALLSSDTILLLQMETLPEENWHLLERAKKRGARTILNLAPAYPVPEAVFRHIDVLVMNQQEAAALALYLGMEIVSPTAAGRHVVATYGLTCLITLGDQGALTYSPQGTWKTHPFSVTPEDTFIGALAASLDKGLDFSQALRRAIAINELIDSLASPALLEAEIEKALKKIPPARQIT